MPVTDRWQTLQTPALLDVAAPDGSHTRAGSQIWYADAWQRTAGCGPTTTAGIVWYLARARGFAARLDIVKADRSEFLGLMTTLFAYVTPTARGVDSTEILRSGAIRFGTDRGFPFEARSLDIPPRPLKRPSEDEVRAFLLASIAADQPVAFLNLSNGSLQNLDNWHWVLIEAIEVDTMAVRICDDGRSYPIDLSAWLKTTLLGGGFVSIST